jgi:hypothetical protein
MIRLKKPNIQLWAIKNQKHITLLVQIAFLAFLTFVAGLLFFGAAKEVEAEYDKIEVAVIRPVEGVPNPCGLDVVVCDSERPQPRVVPKKAIPAVPAKPPTRSKSENETRIREIAKEMGLAQWEIDRAVRIGFCESGLRTTAVGDGGKSYGVWQIHLGYHPNLSKEFASNLETSTRWSLNMMHKGYWNRWSCNRIIGK